jgi:plasmid stabilization system protein ParE
LIVFSPEAAQQVRELHQHYEDRDRPAASRGLAAALEAAWGKIVTSPTAGLPAPRPYPHLARPGVRWIKAGRYWIAWRTEPSPSIIGVFYETANIPRRL